MDQSEDDPFGWYASMESLRSMSGASMSAFPESTAGVWGDEERSAPAAAAARYEQVVLLGQGGMGKVW